MPTTSLGFPYPGDSDYGTGADVPRAVQELADALNEFLTGKYALIKITNIFQGTVSYTPSTGADGLYVEMVGGGGGGGGCATGATNAAAGGGGGGGAYSALFTTTIKTFTVQVGAGGTGVSAANGNNGTSSTFDSPSICTAGGGLGGQVDTVGSATEIGGAGGSGGLPLVGDLQVVGQMGETGMCLAAAQALGGRGGCSHWGGGAESKRTTGAGASGVGALYGSGGGGACILSGGASQAGGAGSNGLIRVHEFQKT